MFIKVKLFSGFPEPLLYQVPDDWTTAPIVGSLVKVPMRNKFCSGVVTEVLHNKPEVGFGIKPAQSIQNFPQDSFYNHFIQKLATYHHVEEIHFLKRIQSFLKHKKEVALTSEQSFKDQQAFLLTSEQLAVVEHIKPLISNPLFSPTVLHGVTGSGKTEVYKKLIEHAITQQKTVLLLLPEVTLAVQFEQLLRKQLLQSIPILSFHSATDAQDKKKLWHNLLQKKSQLIIGVHLPVLLPLPNLGLIIVDEEHEVGYQEKKHPKVNSKEAAILRAQLHGIPIILGSATPSITTLYNVKARNWKLFQLKKRFTGAFPKINFVNLLDKKERRCFWLSDQLIQGIKQQLQKKEQTILFLNRRGVSFFVQCKGCAFVFNCPSCSVSLTLHGDNSLRCHYCQYKTTQPDCCPTCKDKELLKKGIGTQQIVTLLQKIVPHARIARADLDSTVNRAHWQNTVNAMHEGTIDILVGTQTITKGYHFKNVTLVGILWGDSNLNFPYYNAQETTLQQLIQVAGRAGRCHPESQVIVQALRHNQIFNYVHEIDYLNFYEQELAQRKEVGYPPLKRFAEIELKHTKEATVEDESNKLASLLIGNKDIIVLGPTQPPVAKIKKVFSRKIYIKADSFNAISNAYQTIEHKQFKSKIFFTPNPL
jgi:primosomal protein N' (replication factor Y)